ncbi:uncharacterized protein LOC126676836 [Mercurialis annua]|uniref:uncharacterized protein LOC126676836 n=1 Tax=Mercurialis annua TaxID=3986 RepID=UPI00215DEA36|nr:uncharacterized protein LOC126676836 [Mercurialis annua]
MTSSSLTTTRTATNNYTIDDDKDLDDAALWAVIDSAEASHSTTKPRSKPLALRYPNFQSPPTPVSNFSSPPQNPRSQIRYVNNSNNNNNNTSNRNSPYSDPYRRPNKIARTFGSEISDSTSTSPPGLAIVKKSSPVINTVAYSSPEAYLSPKIGKYGSNDGSEVSPGSFMRHNEENDVMRHCLNGRFPSVSLFKDYQDAAMAILEKSDYTRISGHPFIKKTGWRKISLYFNISYEIRDKNIEFDDNRNVQRAEFIVRAHMQGGRFSDGWGSCERREKKFTKPNHDIPSTAETRAKNKACQDLLGIGEYRPGMSEFNK